MAALVMTVFTGPDRGLSLENLERLVKSHESLVVVCYKEQPTRYTDALSGWAQVANCQNFFFEPDRGESVSIPPGAEYFDLAEYYAFRIFLFTVFVIWLYRTLKKDLGR